MRVTEGMRYAEVLQNLTRLSSEHADAANEASTGLRVQKPSDDPVAAAELARLRASNSRTSANLGAIRAVRGDAELTENVLAEASDIMVRIGELNVQAANGVLNGSERQLLGVEVTALKEALVQLSNTRGTRGYLFAGSKVASPAFSGAGTFQGDDVDHLVPIGNSTPTAVSTSGRDSFAVTGGRDAFADIDALITALNTNDQAGISASLDNVDASRRQLVNARARAGLIVSKLDTNQTMLDALNVEQQKRAQDAGAADPVDAYSRVTQLSQSLERAVAVSRQILDIGGVNRF